MQYTTNFYKDTDLNGNAIKSGDTLKVKIEGIPYAMGVVYDGVTKFPLIPDFDDNSDGKVELVFPLVERVNGQYRGLPTGRYILKIRYGYGDGITDEFFIS